MIFKFTSKVKDLMKSGYEKNLDGWENWYFELPKDGAAKWRKIRISTWKDFQMNTKGWPRVSVIGEGPLCNCGQRNECGECGTLLGYWECPNCPNRFPKIHNLSEPLVCPGCSYKAENAKDKSIRMFQEGVNYIELILMCGDGKPSEIIMAMDASLYIMNNEGKTIDTVNCFNG